LRAERRSNPGGADESLRGARKTGRGQARFGAFSGTSSTTSMVDSKCG
jgi:hypothetical protein